MDVTIYLAKLVVEEREVPLTKQIAKSFPILSASDRWDDFFNKAYKLEPICKVARKTLIPDSFETSFLLLVNHPEYGLCWQAPIGYDANFPGLEDDLAVIPTVVLR